MSNDELLSTYNLNHVEHELGSFLLLRAHLERGDTHLIRRDLKGDITTAVLPERAHITRTVSGVGITEVLADVDNVAVLLHSWKTGGWACASASSAEAAGALLDELAARVPSPYEPRRVDVAFTDRVAGSRYVSIDIRPWDEIDSLYSPNVRNAMTALLTHRPTRDEARRLVLWHGEPGTGKTSAIRALLNGWRDWADGVIVSDPEALLRDGRYLRGTVLEHEDNDRWQLFVLEDAESLLHKGSGGEAMSKLLNLADGLLGQGLRCLFLITTNEPLMALHPALVRPGRCLARVEFEALPSSQVAGILGRPVDRAMTLAEVMAVKPLSVEAEPVAVGQYL
jgi:hypothetical protein